MPARPRTKQTGGSWSDNRIDSSKPFNLKFYPNETTIDRWVEVSFGNLPRTINISKNSFSVEKMCYESVYAGSRMYKGCYYPATDPKGKNYSTPTLIYTLRNNKGENVGYSTSIYHKARIEERFNLFNPQSLMIGVSGEANNLLTFVNEDKLGNDGKVYGKAFVALFPTLPDVPQVHPSYYETHSAESAQRLFFTEYNEAKYLSQLDGRLASNIVNFQIQVRMPTPTITVKKKRMKVIM